MEKVEPKKRQPVLKEILVFDSVFNAIQSSGKYSTASEVEAAAVDIFVNCHPSSLWERLAKSLYRHHQVAAVEEVRSYLPPRGQSCCGVGVYLSCSLAVCTTVDRDIFAGKVFRL